MVEEEETLRLAASATTERWLVVLSGTKTQQFPLPASSVVTIGRSPKCDVILSHPSVSREHLRIITVAGLFVEDLGAANPTRVGGTTLKQGERVPLTAGTLVDVGALGIMVREGPKATADERSTPASLDVARFAKSSLTLLIQGETGAGKEIMAEQIHALSPRASFPLLRLNCAAMTDSLMESELFGHERGAFTGAVAAKPGLLETANGGTVFLDEIGDLSLFLQAKLLRVLEERKVWRVGALKSRPIDVRFLAATNRELDRLVAEGRFRQDLLFRLNVVTLRVPPLRERQNEIEPLAERFIAEACKELGRSPLSLSPDALQALLRHSWPGNVRELRNAIGRAATRCAGDAIAAGDLGLSSVDPDRPTTGDAATGANGETLHAAVEALEEDRIVKALKASGFNRTKAAQALGIARNTLLARMARFGIQVPDRD